MVTELKPQKGPQEDFMACEADICIYGGAAGGGKSYALLLEPLRHMDNPRFGSVTFRREQSQITNEGGLWDTTFEIYSKIAGAKPLQSPKYHWKMPKGAKFNFSHLQHIKYLSSWDGAQVALIMWDELQHFPGEMFWYMFSRMRSTCGIRPYMRATCNPNPDSFLVQLLEWWIDQETGDPILDRSGIIRHIIRVKGEVHWGESREELTEQFPGCKPKSFTFIASSLQDNPALLEADPDYEANIEAMLDYERKRLKGNWFARPTAGELFKRSYFDFVDEIDYTQVVGSMRYWDRAATKPSEVNPDPDWTAGVLVYQMLNGDYIIADIARERMDPGAVEDLIDNCDAMDRGEYSDTVMGLEQEPGASGKMEVAYYERKFLETEVLVFPKTKSKLTCWKPVAVIAKKKRIKLLTAPWNRPFLQEAEGVTDGSQDCHDDQIDALAGAINHFNEGSYGFGSVGGI